MGKKTEIVALPTKMLAVELGSKKRWKRIVVIGLALGVVVGGAVTVVVRTADQKEAAALETSWSDLNGCLLGDALGADETTGSRLASVQLAVLGTPKEKRGKPNAAPWPASCAPYAFALSEHANAAETGGPALAEAAQALGQSLKNDATALVDERPLAEKVWAAAAAAKLKGAAPSPDATRAPPPAKPVFDGAAFAALPKLLSGNFTLASVFHDASSGDGKLYLLVDKKEAADGPALCTATGADAQMQCMKVPDAAAKLSPGLRLLGTTDSSARPFYFAGDRGQLGIFPPDGKDKVGAAVTLGATARADGSLLALTHAEGGKDVKLLVAPATGAASERAGIAAADVESPPVAGLFWDWLVYKSPGKAGAPGHLFARKIPEGAGDFGPAVDVGAFDEPPIGDKEKESGATLTGCRTSEATAVRIRGGRADGVSIFAGGRWSAPAKTATHGGALTCRGVEATVTDVRTVMESDKNFAVVTQSRCSASGCNTSTVNLRELFGALAEIAPNDAHSVAAADMGGQLLLVWSGGATGGLRMRVASSDAMKQTPDVILTDGRDPAGAGGAMGTITEVRAIATGNAAVILVGTTSGVKALRVDGAGKVSPLRASL